MYYVCMYYVCTTIIAYSAYAGTNYSVGFAKSFGGLDFKTYVCTIKLEVSVNFHEFMWLRFWP